MFDRLYNDSQKFIDQIAERSVGAGHRLLVDPVLQSRHIAWMISKIYHNRVQEPEAIVETSLLTEYGILAVIKFVRTGLAQKNELSDGTDNLLQEVADKHEEFVYLLKQRASYSYAR